MKFLNAPIEFETKAFGDAGTFEGYAAIFGNIDFGGDIIERDAFKEFAKNTDGKTIVLNQHNMRDPIGLADVVQDSKGLAFKGQLVLEAPSARTAYALMKAKALGGMSMGYDVLAGGAETLKSGIRSLKALKLWEISPVTFGMNALAGISGVKSFEEVIKAGRLPTLSDFEDLLREAGFSKTQSAVIANRGLKHLLDRSESGGETSGVLAALQTWKLPT
jgi:HK97 family phage prohead protease